MSGDAISSGVALLLPGLQAIATILILEKQKEFYDDLAEERKDIIDQAVENFVNCIDAQIASGAFGDAYGSVPTAILYDPVDAAKAIADSANDSLAAIPASKRYVEAANRIMEQDNIVRVMALDGRYVCSSDLISCSINEMLQGHLPVDDVVEILKDSAEQAAMNGRVGNTHGMTMRDLGISRLRAQRAGQAAFQSHLASLNQNVSPISSNVAISDFLQSPAERLALAASEAQLIQQSLQNQANAAAAGDPTAYGILQAELNKCVAVLGNEAQRANLQNTFTPNYGALLMPAIDSISESLIGTGGPAEVTSADYNMSNAARTPTADQNSGK